MTSGRREWPVPVIRYTDRHTDLIRVTVVDGAVVAKGPSVAYEITSNSRDLLVEALAEAFELGQQMDQGLS